MLFLLTMGICRLMVPVWWVSFFWQTQACCWLAGTALWGQFQYNSDFQMNRRCRCCRPPLWLFVWRERGRQPLPQTWVHFSSQNRVSSHPRKVGHNMLPGILNSVFSLKPQALFRQTNQKHTALKFKYWHSIEKFYFKVLWESRQ